MTGAELRDAAAGWLARDPDPATRAELEALLAAGDDAALRDRLDGRLAFGTAGLRAAMGAGPARMNRLVVRESAAGIARHLLAHDPAARDRGAVVIHDARRNSRAFAADCAEVLAAHGIPVVAGADPLPTPVGVYAIRRLGCAAGIVITASHNPAADNGLKLYLGDGAQIAPPVDAQVAARIAEVAADGAVTPPGTAPAPVTALPADVVDGYCRDVLRHVPAPARRLRIATTAMHGVGGALLARILAQAGHGDVHAVAEQEAPDPDFPTVAFPNPEEPGATDLLAALMARCGADLGLAVDPDADRVAVLVPAAGGPRRLTGDDVGALLGEWLLAEVTAGRDRLTVTSVVSSSLLGRIAAAHGAHHVETLTGFKWLSRPAIAHPGWTQVIAYEEAIGYAVGPDARDKDGLAAAAAVAAMASAYAARGWSLLDALDALHLRHGAHVTANFSLRYEGTGWRERRDATLARLVETPPERIGGAGVSSIRMLAADVMRIDLAGDLRVVVRPSGTEPKLKCYCEAVEPVTGGDLTAARARAAARLDAVRGALGDLLGA
ncbi:MAG: phospho-sugar mutase [Actinomycetota bacterium]